MAPSQAPVDRSASSAQPLSFCFPVRWTTLAQPQVALKIEEKPARRPAVPRPDPAAETRSISVVAPSVVAPSFDAPASDAPAIPLPNPRLADSWEMVIPKTSRPSARPSRVPAPEPVKTLPAIPEAPQTASEPEVSFSTLGGFQRKPGLRFSMTTIVASAMFLVLAIGGIVLATTTTTPAAAPVLAQAAEIGRSLPVGLAGWNADFAGPGGSQKGRRVSVLRGSQKLTDFRLEFQGQILSKSLSWVFRAKDARNFYVMKLEIIKPLPESTGVLTRFAVIDGQEQPRVRIPLAMPLRPNTPYNVRLDALGSTFTTSVQGQQVDQWKDPQIRDGGVGLYTELGDRGTLNGDMSVFTLLAKAQLKR